MTSFQRFDVISTSIQRLFNVVYWIIYFSELPKPPEGLTAESRTTNEITLKWELVPLATRYQIEFKYPNNKTETFFKSGGFQLAMMDGLQPETSYSVRIRSETLTGPSNFSEPLIVKTLSLGLWWFFSLCFHTLFFHKSLDIEY